MTKRILTRSAVKNFLHRTNGKLFSVVFTKKDGTIRTLIGRLGVKSHLSGGENTTRKYDKYITVYDMNNAGYRNVNVNNIQTIKFQGCVYTVI